MILIDNIRNVQFYNCTNLIIVRSLKHPVNNASHVPTLSPSVGLLCNYQRWKKDGLWNEKTFQELYVPQFIKEMKESREARDFLNALYRKSKTEDIVLYCFCPNEELCHRSIVAGMLLGAGANVSCNHDYKKYWTMYKSL